MKLKNIYLLSTALLVVVGSTASAQMTLNGAGATFPAPLYQRWFAEYNKTHPDVQVNYQAVGSGSGIKQVIQGVVNFGASDAAMTDEEIAKVGNGVVMLPMTAGSIVLAYNLPDVKELKLSRDVYAGIFLGTITKWNDAAIKKDNPTANLPDLAITVAYRSDGSGTNFVFTKHLAAISADFKTKVGEGKSVSWPAGVGGKGNDGVTSLIKQTPGTIGYVEFGYAKQNSLAMASLQNKSGNFVAPSAKSGASTLASVEFPENLRIWPSDPAGAEDYPIATFTWLLLYGKYDDAKTASTLKDIVKYGVTDGQKFADELGYIPLPDKVVKLVEDKLSKVQP
ncbi:MAG: phosphate ABC transporter substrate-binding protein PstS [Chthoniobacteraceae bacterium]